MSQEQLGVWVALFSIGSRINREILLNLKGASVIHTLLLWAFIALATITDGSELRIALIHHHFTGVLQT